MNMGSRLVLFELSMELWDGPHDYTQGRFLSLFSIPSLFFCAEYDGSITSFSPNNLNYPKRLILEQIYLIAILTLKLKKILSKTSTPSLPVLPCTIDL